MVYKPVGFFYVWVDILQEEFGVYSDFPTDERLVEVLVHNNQPSFTKLCLDGDGNIITRIKITKLEELI